MIGDGSLSWESPRQEPPDRYAYDPKHPVPSGIEALKDEVSPYVAGRGTLQFPLDEPIPYNLIKKMVIFRAKENLAKKGSRQ